MKVQINQERFDELLGDEFFGFFEGNIAWLYKALSHFVLDDNGDYVDEDTAMKWLRSTYKIKDVKQIRSEFLKELQEKAVPLPKEKT